MTAISITWTDLSPAALRGEAARTADAWAARRLLAIAVVLDGHSRETAAETRAMDRQTLCDWVHRYNEDGVAGLAGVNGEAMNKHLAEISRNVPAGAIALLIVDGAGWHTSPRLKILDNIVLPRLPPCAPELNPAGNLWAYLRANWLSHRLFNSYEDIADACCNAWNALMALPDVIWSIGSREYAQVKIQGPWYQAASERTMGHSARRQCRFRGGDGRHAGGLSTAPRSGTPRCVSGRDPGTTDHRDAGADCREAWAAGAVRLRV